MSNKDVILIESSVSHMETTLDSIENAVSSVDIPINDIRDSASSIERSVANISQDLSDTSDNSLWSYVLDVKLRLENMESSLNNIETLLEELVCCMKEATN